MRINISAGQIIIFDKYQPLDRWWYIKIATWFMFVIHWHIRRNASMASKPTSGLSHWTQNLYILDFLWRSYTSNLKESGSSFTYYSGKFPCFSIIFPRFYIAWASWYETMKKMQIFQSEFSKVKKLIWSSALEW